MDSTQEFWNWFASNSEAYTFLDEVDEVAKEKLMDDLLEHLHKYSDALYFEIGGMPGEDLELVITAEGNIDYFDEVENLIINAPLISGWRFIALKQPAGENFTTEWDGLELRTADMRFFPAAEAEKNEFGITVYLENYDAIKNAEILETMVLKILDTILGERSFAKDIASVEISPLPDDTQKKLLPLIELPGYIQKHKRTLEN